MAKAAETNNVYAKGSAAEKLLQSFFVIEDEKALIMGTAMNKCKRKADDQRDMIRGAGEAGMNKKALRARIKAIRLERKLVEATDFAGEEDGEVADAYTALAHALEGTPFAEYASRMAAEASA